MIWCQTLPSSSTSFEIVFLIDFLYMSKSYLFDTVIFVTCCVQLNHDCGEIYCYFLYINFQEPTVQKFTVKSRQ